MIRLLVSARISVEEPSTDGGFITWYDVLIQRDAPGVDDDGANGDDLEKVEQIGRAKLAIVHVGALFDTDDTSLYDVLDAESGDLEALYSLYFDDEYWFRDEFASAAGVDLGYIQELTIDAAWQGRNIDLAVVQRLNETLAAGCKVLVMALSSPEAVEHWEQMGFEVPAGEDSEPRLVHLNNEGTHPRVVAAPHEEDRFEVLSTEDEEVEPSRSPVISPRPTLDASPVRTQDAAARRATAARRPARHRR
jgi:hypothetical protein